MAAVLLILGYIVLLNSLARLAVITVSAEYQVGWFIGGGVWLKQDAYF